VHNIVKRGYNTEKDASPGINSFPKRDLEGHSKSPKLVPSTYSNVITMVVNDIVSTYSTSKQGR